MRQILIFGIAVLLLCASTTFAAPNDVWRVDSIVAPSWNFEMMIGDSITPKAIFRNLSSTPQSFTCTFRILNFRTGVEVYWNRDSVLNLSPNSSQAITFAPWRTQAQFDEEAGTMLCEAYAAPLAKDSLTKSDTQPGDDTLRELLFVIHRLDYLSDFNNNFSVSPFAPSEIPDCLKWVNHGAEVVDGDSLALLPPPPRGLQGDPAVKQINSPVIKLDRRDVNGNFYSNCAGSSGDTIISFPINIGNIRYAACIFSFERGGKISDDSGAASTFSGPERTVTSPRGDALRAGDRLIVEFADSNQITNVTTWKQMWSSDGGHDAHFIRVAMGVDTQFTTNHFRFRIRLEAHDNSIPGVFNDDDDAWFVDNLVVVSPLKPELEFSYVTLDSTFALTHLPPRQASALQIDGSVFNNGGIAGSAFGSQFLIADAHGKNLFNQLKTVNGLGPTVAKPIGTQWGAGNFGSGTYSVSWFILPKGYDAESQNDSTFSYVTLQLDSVMAYDNGANDVAVQTHKTLGLNIPPTSALGGDGVRSTSSGSIAMKFSLNVPDTIHGAMVWFGSYDTSATPIEIKIYHSAGDHPGAVISDPCATLRTTRSAPWDTYHQYNFSCPVALDTGDYWLGVTQKISGALDLGGSAARSACEWVVYDSSSSQQDVIVPVHRELADKFAWEDSANSGRWNSFFPAHGFPAYGNRDSVAQQQTISCGTQQISHTEFVNEHSWVPMLRLSFNTAEPFVHPSIEVRLSSFTGKLSIDRINGVNSISSNWVTTFERNVRGFFLEFSNSTTPWTIILEDFNLVNDASAGNDTAYYNFDWGIWALRDEAYQCRLCAVGFYNDTLALDTISLLPEALTLDSISGYVIAPDSVYLQCLTSGEENISKILFRYGLDYGKFPTGSAVFDALGPADTNKYSLRVRPGFDTGMVNFELLAIGILGDTIYINSTQFLMAPTSVATATPIASLLFLQSYPEPFTDNTAIAFATGATKNYSLVITDVLGRIVRTIAQQNSSHNNLLLATWDGRDDHNNLVPAGTYCCRLRTAMEQCEMMMRKVR